MPRPTGVPDMSGGELHYDDPALRSHASAMGLLLNVAGIISFSYGAFGTAHRMIALDSRMLAGHTYPPQTIAGVPPGIGLPSADGYTLWIKNNENKGQAVWLQRGGHHVPEYIADKFCHYGGKPNLTDGVGLAVLLLLIEEERGLGDYMDREQVDAEVRQWVESAPGVGRELPAYLQSDQTEGGTPDG